MNLAVHSHQIQLSSYILSTFLSLPIFPILVPFSYIILIHFSHNFAPISTLSSLLLLSLHPSLFSLVPCSVISLAQAFLRV